MNSYNAPHPEWIRIARYVSGNSSPEERVEFERWLHAHPEHRALMDRVTKLWFTRQRAASDDVSDLDIQLARLSARIGSGSLPAHRRRISSKPWMRNAISLLLATLVVLVGTLAIRNKHSRNALNTFASNEYKVYTTRPGQREMVELRDGSRIYINAGSTLEVPRGFGANNRTVRLVGHATFKVQNRTDVPFIVNAAGTQTTVLGTDFSVRAYTGDVRVTVRSGRVSMGVCEAEPSQQSGECRTHRKNTVISANEGASVTSTGVISLDQHADISRDFAFSTDRLLLDGATLGSMIDELNRWYDADIQLTNHHLEELRLGGWLSAGSIDEFIQYLTRALSVRATKHGRVVVISPLG